ncbi:MAG: hypothetical protein MJE77_03910 [Proteobacteria bacterium]|nr:hypothetical protein [Pseudomonadota bacterium]
MKPPTITNQPRQHPHRRTLVAAALAGAATLWGLATNLARRGRPRRHCDDRGRAAGRAPAEGPSGDPATRGKRPPIWLGHL